MKKYRMGNQPEEYELKEDYLGWVIENLNEMELLNFSLVKNKELIIVNLKNKK